MSLTKEQQLAIDYAQLGKHNLLISASAGTGKTFTLTQRIIKRLLAGAVEPEQLLITTFTEKAALGMRRKFEQAVQDKFRELGSQAVHSSEGQRLLYLQQSLPNMRITTIHSFCKSILDEYLSDLAVKGELKLDLDFSIAEETETSLKLEQAIELVLESIYAHLAVLSKAEERAIALEPLAEDYAQRYIELVQELHAEATEQSLLEQFSAMTSVLSHGSNDANLRNLLRENLSYLRSLAQYREFVKQAIADHREYLQNYEQQPQISGYLQRLQQAAVAAQASWSELEQTAYFTSNFCWAGKRLQSSANKPSKEVQRISESWPELKRSIEEIAALEELSWDRLYHLRPRLEELPTIIKRGSEDKLEFRTLLGQRIFPFLNFFYQVSATYQEDFQLPIELPLKHALDTELTELRQGHEIMVSFLALVLTVDEVFSEMKLADNEIDFDDLQHYAFELLQQPSVAQSLNERYREIYIDEYQDTNSVQESIISQFADNNVFMVGDIKQSIYRFRYANPDLFRDKNSSYSNLLTDEATSSGYYLPFRQNFRCDRAVIELVNQLFTTIMRAEYADIDYDGEHQLIYGKNYPAPTEERDCGRKPQLTVVSQYRSAIVNEPQSKYYFEVQACAEQIAEIMAEGAAHASGKKPAYSDFMLLAPTNDLCRIFAENLQQLGIPAAYGKSNSIYLFREIKIILDFFRLLDNFCCDYPLAAVMRSELWYQPVEHITTKHLADQADSEILRVTTFSEDELYTIACSGEQPYFYQKVLALAAVDLQQLPPEQKPLRSLIIKVQHFYRYIEQCRRQLETLNPAEFFEEFLLQSGYRDYLALLPQAEQKLNNLQTFRENLLAICTKQRLSIGQFIRYIEEMLDNGAFASDMQVAASEDDVVRVMTIHAAKGLEANFVFLVGLNKSLGGNRRRGAFLQIGEDPNHRVENIISTKSVILERDENFTLEPRFSTVATYRSHLYRAHDHLLEQKQRAENLRVLYVAMTRAQKELRLFATVNTEERNNADKAFLANNPVLTSPEQAKTYLDYFYYYIAQDSTSRQRLEQARSEVLISQQRTLDQSVEERETSRTITTPFVDVKFWNAYAAQAQSTTSIQSVLPPRQQCDFSDYQRYWQPLPTPVATLVPNKITVSEVKRRSQQVAEEELSPAEINLTFRDPEVETPAQTGSRGASFGSFLHGLVQYLPLNLFVDVAPDQQEQHYQQYLQQMIAAGQLASSDRQLAEQVFMRIRHYLTSPLAERIRRSSTVYRESPFTMLYDKEAGTLIQGVIDLWFVEDDEIVLIDFKSDYLRDQPDPAACLYQRYHVQLQEYAKALQEIYHRPVKQKLIWSLNLNRQFELP